VIITAYTNGKRLYSNKALQISSGMITLKWEVPDKFAFLPVGEGKRNICHGTNGFTGVGGYGNECRSTHRQQRKSAA